MDNIRFHEKTLSFLSADWRMFGDALVAEYPRAFYYPFYLAERYDSEKPRLLIAQHMCDLVEANNLMTTEIIMVFDCSYVPVVRKDDFGFWSAGYPPCPYAQFSPGERIFNRTAHEPQHISQGSASVTYRRNVAEDAALAKRFFRIFRRFATLRNQVCLTYPEGDMVEASATGFGVWLGHEAIRWAREDNSRMLGVSGKVALRPYDDGITKLALDRPA